MCKSGPVAVEATVIVPVIAVTVAVSSTSSNCTAIIGVAAEVIAARTVVIVRNNK